MWNVSDVEDGATYRVWLCSDHGRRYLELARDGQTPADGLACTAVVSNSLLRLRDETRISEEVRLADGGRFVVDAHGIWFTQAEREAMRHEVDFVRIPWLGPVPRLAPK